MRGGGGDGGGEGSCADTVPKKEESGSQAAGAQRGAGDNAAVPVRRQLNIRVRTP